MLGAGVVAAGLTVVPAVATTGEAPGTVTFPVRSPGAHPGR